MTAAIRHHKMIVSDSLKSTIPRTGIRPRVFSREIKLFDDPYFQQLWLDQLVKHKETFIEIANHLGGFFRIPICSAHELIEQEQANLYKIIKELECDEITFNFFTNDFQNFQYKDKDLKTLLKQSRNMKIISDDIYQRIHHKPHKIKLYNLEETIEKIEQQTLNQEKPFRAPIKLIQNNQILKRLPYKINSRKLTVKAYRIIQKLISENFELFHNFLEYPKNQNTRYEDHPEYLAFCEQYGKAEMDYIINNYLRAIN